MIEHSCQPHVDSRSVLGMCELHATLTLLRNSSEDSVQDIIRHRCAFQHLMDTVCRRVPEAGINAKDMILFVLDRDMWVSEFVRHLRQVI